MSSVATDFGSRMMPHLESLARKMLNNRDFGYLSTVADLMSGLHSGKWSRLPKDDKEYYLKKMSSDFHPKGMGDSQYGFDSDYQSILELLSAEERALRIQ